MLPRFHSNSHSVCPPHRLSLLWFSCIISQCRLQDSIFRNQCFPKGETEGWFITATIVLFLVPIVGLLQFYFSFTSFVQEPFLGILWHTLHILSGSTLAGLQNRVTSVVRQLFSLGRAAERFSQRELHHWAHGNPVTPLCIREPVFERNALKIMQWNNNAMRYLLMSIVVVTKIKGSVRTTASRNTKRESFTSLVFNVERLRGCGSNPPQWRHVGDTEPHRKQHAHKHTEFNKEIPTHSHSKAHAHTPAVYSC